MLVDLSVAPVFRELLGFWLTAVARHMAQRSAFKYILSISIFMVTYQCFENYWIYLIESCHWALGAAISIQSFNFSFWLYSKPVFWELLGIWLIGVTGHKAQQSAFSYMKLFSHYRRPVFWELLGIWLTAVTGQKTQQSEFSLIKLFSDYGRPVFWELLGIWLIAVTGHKAQRPAFMAFYHSASEK